VLDVSFVENIFYQDISMHILNRNLTIVQTNAFLDYAQSNSCDITSFSDDLAFEFGLMPVHAIRNCQTYSLPPIRLHNFGGMLVKLPESIVRGRGWE